jgi:hypothetical protein
MKKVSLINVAQLGICLVSLSVLFLAFRPLWAPKPETPMIEKADEELVQEDVPQSNDGPYNSGYSPGLFYSPYSPWSVPQQPYNPSNGFRSNRRPSRDLGPVTTPSPSPQQTPKARQSTPATSDSGLNSRQPTRSVSPVKPNGTTRPSTVPTRPAAKPSTANSSSSRPAAPRPSSVRPPAPRVSPSRPSSPRRR